MGTKRNYTLINLALLMVFFIIATGIRVESEAEEIRDNFVFSQTNTICQPNCPMSCELDLDCIYCCRCIIGIVVRPRCVKGKYCGACIEVPPPPPPPPDSPAIY
ncbi:hypothetical protein P8452_41044 [Trifolium repens]|nr:hypothetical protein P8452_41044 [Trifolium repens]